MVVVLVRTREPARSPLRLLAELQLTAAASTREGASEFALARR